MTTKPTTELGKLATTITTAKRRASLALNGASHNKFKISGEWRGVAVELTTQNRGNEPRFVTTLTKNSAFDLPKGTVSATLSTIGRNAGVSLNVTVEPSTATRSALPEMYHERLARITARG